MSEDRYPHESPILIGMLMVVIALLIIIWRIQNPWIPSPEMYDDMDFIPILACGLGIMGVSFIITDIFPGEIE